MHHRLTHNARLARAVLGCLAIGAVQVVRPAPHDGCGAARIAVHFDYSAAEALTAALESHVVTDVDAQRLLRVRGVAAMVDNVTKYDSALTRGAFTTDLAQFATTHRAAHPDFDLATVFASRDTTRALLDRLRATEREVIGGMCETLDRYRPAAPRSVVTVYLVAGGVSDGFVLDRSDDAELFVAADKAHGDLPGLRQNITHELYHVLQRASAATRPAVGRFVRDPSLLPAAERVLELTTLEGTANFIVDPREAKGTGRYLDMWRARYARNTTPERIRENFALFDRVVTALRKGTMPWTTADSLGFSGDNDARFYFVGYVMARTLVEHGGARALDSLFLEPPWRLASDYLALCRMAPQCPARLDPATGAWVAELDRRHSFEERDAGAGAPPSG